MSSPQPGSYPDALQRLLATQHAAVYGYPQLGVQLDDAGQVARARALEAAHRLTRDALLADLAGRSVTPPAPQPSYVPAEPVTSAVTAQRWALQLETDCAAAYRFLLAATVTAPAQPATARRAALTGLTTAATNAAGWRALLTPSTPTVALPGL